MLSSSCVLASLEEPQAGMALTGRLLCIEGERLLVVLCWLSLLMVVVIVQLFGKQSRMRRLTSSLSPRHFAPHITLLT
jgi:hypothetical protein